MRTEATPDLLCINDYGAFSRKAQGLFCPDFSACAQIVPKIGAASTTRVKSEVQVLYRPPFFYQQLARARGQAKRQLCPELCPLQGPGAG
jgi:hypothetical protein